jgi:7,8-dihydropterin-6-yl-methyl-4-(beta-D-ribofuranosyl)aminobenzene 5'-phosphate synthase
MVNFHNQKMLFDTGGDGKILLDNMHKLGIDPSCINSVVLSHAHNDHTNGLLALVMDDIHPTIYLLPSFSHQYKSQIRGITPVIEVQPFQSLNEGLFTTGEMGAGIKEQSLIIRSDQGLVILTGCAHPGIVEIIKQIKNKFSEPVYLVMGGFHLNNKSKRQINEIINNFRLLGVHKVAPCHCTGDLAIEMFEAEYGKDFIFSGVGKIIKIEPTNP